VALNRVDFQQLADVRIAEAGVLLAAGMWDGAYYYLAGYAVECALKACIAKLTKAEEFTDKDRAIKAFTHKIDELVVLAGLRAARDAEVASDPQFSRNWDTAKAWTEGSRYERIAESVARALYHAVTDPAHGVLPWVKRHW
jgi:hypothetical protein